MKKKKQKRKIREKKKPKRPKRVSGKKRKFHGARPAKPGPKATQSQKGLKQIIEMAKARGQLTYEELNDILPSEIVSSEEIDRILAILSEKNIKIVEGPSEKIAEIEEDAKKKAAPKEEPHQRIAHLDDPVKMYLRQMGQISLLTRQEELALAEKIEATEEKFRQQVLGCPLSK